MSIRRFPAVFFTLFILGATLQGCNTMQGVGEDLEQGGEAIQDAAE